MKNLSDTILCVILALFFLSFMTNVPTDIWNNLTKGKNNFSDVANNYNANVSDKGSMFAKSKSLEDITPAAGDETEPAKKSNEKPE